MKWILKRFRQDQDADLETLRVLEEENAAEKLQTPIIAAQTERLVRAKIRNHFAESLSMGFSINAKKA